jgi:hypothetical protein
VMEKCESCGTKENLQRHHINLDTMDNSIHNLVVLCQSCHAAVHIKENTWGRGNIAEAICQICGEIFLPKQSRYNKICGKVECRRESGRRAVNKRWLAIRKEINKNALR